MTYREYLNSPYWQELRMTVLARDGAACRVCGDVDWLNHAHHTTYDGGRYLEQAKHGHLRRAEHIVTLCPEHHEMMDLLSDIQKDIGITGAKKMRGQFEFMWSYRKALTGSGFDIIRETTAKVLKENLPTASR